MADPKVRVWEPGLGSRLQSCRVRGSSHSRAAPSVRRPWKQYKPLPVPALPTGLKVASAHPWVSVSSLGSLPLFILGDCSPPFFISSLILGGSTRQILLSHRHLAPGSSDFCHQLAENRFTSEGWSTLSKFMRHKIRMPVYYLSYKRDHTPHNLHHSPSMPAYTGTQLSSGH